MKKLKTILKIAVLALMFFAGMQLYNHAHRRGQKAMLKRVMVFVDSINRADKAAGVEYFVNHSKLQ